MTLESIQEKVPKAKYPPKEGCKRCKGTGFIKLKPELQQKLGKTEVTCICLFVDHEYSDELGNMLGEFATQELKKLHNGEYDASIKLVSQVIGKLVGRKLPEVPNVK